MRRPARIVALVVTMLIVSGHVGSPNVFYEGMAGPYPVRVIIRPPEVIPGIADITVRVSAEDVRRVTVQPFRWDAGEGGAPPPDEAQPVPGARDLYSAELWFMTAGSHSVHVTVEGDGGSGTAIVPVAPVRLRTLAMQRGLGVALLAAGAFLFIGAVTIIGAASRESVVPPGERPTRRDRRRAGLVMAAGGMVFAALLFGGKSWWDAVDREYRNNIFEPLHMPASTRRADGQRILILSLDDPEWLNRNWTPLVPDHGKLMHMFMVRTPDLDGFAHLHPVPLDSNTFQVPLPPLPAGRYRIYADVVHESGFAQTMVDTAEIPAVPSTAPGGRPAMEPDPDDSWHVAPEGGAAAAGSGPPADTLADGSVMSWAEGDSTLASGEPLDFTFAVRGPDGTPATLEPYMGMLSHAAISRDDGQVFIHLHPVGSISLGSQQTFLERQSGDSVRGTLGRRLTEAAAPRHAGMMQDETGVVRFPYEFPRAGRYRIWVQVKRAGTVLTGVFDTEVQ